MRNRRHHCHKSGLLVVQKNYHLLVKMVKNVYYELDGKDGKAYNVAHTQ